MTLLLAIVLGCANPTAPAVEGSPATALQREGVVEPVVAVTADCALLATCPQEGVDAARCVEDPDLFVVETLGEGVAAVEVATGAAGDLEDGEWFGVFPDPAGGCALTVVSFRIDGGVL